MWIFHFFPGQYFKIFWRKYVGKFSSLKLENTHEKWVKCINTYIYSHILSYTYTCTYTHTHTKTNTHKNWYNNDTKRVCQHFLNMPYAQIAVQHRKILIRLVEKNTIFAERFFYALRVADVVHSNMWNRSNVFIKMWEARCYRRFRLSGNKRREM